MPVNVGARLGPYQIEGRLGAGGMGEVYRARDTRLNRTVAIKVLSPDIACDPDRRLRFRREAEAVAALSHPHICVLHDLGQHDGIDYLVMEHLEGETLANRIEHAPLPLDAALEYAIQIAAALDGAHRAGVIHRDLKPSNIMLTQAGVKLLDFGLAKLRPVQGIVSGVPSDPTVTVPLTREGSLLGTLQYMAPEQLQGKEADARSDLFALGAIVYEMTAGRKAFVAPSDAGLIGAILRDEPPSISILQPLAPRALDRLVRACLAKDPADRWQSAGDLARELGWILEDHRASTPDGDVVPIHGPVRHRAAAISTALALTAVLAAIAVNSVRKTADAPLPAKFTIRLPDSTWASAPVPVAQISPDGRHLAFIVQTAELGRISLRPLDAQRAESVPGTEGAVALFWSPDSRHLAFTTVSDALKKLTIADLTVETLCDGCQIGRNGGGTWGGSGLIVFPSQDGRLVAIPAAGGEARTLTTPNRSVGEIAHVAPHFLPDGRRFLYVSRNAEAQRSGLYVREAGSAEPRLLLQGDHPAIYASAGYLLFSRSGNIVARAFDVSRLEFTSDVIPLVASSEYWPTPGHSADVIFRTWFGTWPSYSASDTGILAYTIAEQPQSQFQWVGQSGEAQLLGEPGSYTTFDLTPDDRRLVFSRGETAQASLWVLDLARGVASRVTFGASSYYDPRWGPRGQWIAANRLVGPMPAIVRILPDGGESVLSPHEGEVCILDDVSNDGQWVLCRRNGAQELVAKRLLGGPQPTVVRKSPAGTMDQSQFSPDGRWIGYSADESGRYEVYVTAFPSTGERWQISRDGGVQPVWRRDGEGLYYLGLDGLLKAVAFRTDDRPQFSIPKPLFDTGLKTPLPWVEQYAVSADGRRFLLLKPAETKVRNSVGVILNWPTLFQAGRIER
jgi:serine/threonine protein kinase/Tol biopolymer transport system component